MFALTNFNAPSHDQEGATAANQWRVCAIVLLLFIVAATVSAIRKDVTQGFDEVAHASYIAYLQDSGGTWPAFEDMRMLDPLSFHFTREGNYLNHPSPYYLLLARLGPDLEGHPDAILVHRLFNVALGAIGLAALLAVGLVAKLPRLAFYAYIVPLAAVPVLAPLAGAVNNDNAAFAGGSIATLLHFNFWSPEAVPSYWSRSAASLSRRARGEIEKSAYGCYRPILKGNNSGNNWADHN